MAVLSEKKIEREFKKINKKLLKRIGHKKATTNHELHLIGRELFGKSWAGVHMQDSKIPNTPKKAYLIINVDTEGMSGSHWVAVHRTSKNTYYIFDTFGRKSKKLLPIFTRGKIHIDSDHDQNQWGDSEICGTLSLAWLLCVKQFGIRNALKV